MDIGSSVTMVVVVVAVVVTLRRAKKVRNTN